MRCRPSPRASLQPRAPMRAKTDPRGHTSTTLAVSIERCADLPGEIVLLLAGRAPTCRRKPALRRWPRRSRRAGSASRHQQLKEELGLDHFEGRSWRGLHRHALMAMIAYAFLQHLRLAAASGEKKVSAGPPQPTLPAIRKAVVAALARAPPTDAHTAAPNQDANPCLGVVNKLLFCQSSASGLSEARRSAKTPGFPRLEQG